MNNVDELKQRLIAVWDGTQQNVIDSAVDECESDSEHVCVQTVDSSNIFYDLLD